MKNWMGKLLSFIGIEIVVRNGMELDLSGFTRQELEELLDYYQIKLAALQLNVPQDAQDLQAWEDAAFCLEDQIEQVEQALFDAPEDPFWRMSRRSALHFSA